MGMQPGVEMTRPDSDKITECLNLVKELCRQKRIDIDTIVNRETDDVGRLLMLTRNLWWKSEIAPTLPNRGMSVGDRVTDVVSLPIGTTFEKENSTSYIYYTRTEGGFRTFMGAEYRANLWTIDELKELKFVIKSLPE